MSANFNPLPLITVKPGLDNSLADISRYVEAYFASSGQDQESLHKAQEELHRIGGVLRMLSLNGLVVFCGEMEKLLQEIPSQDVSIMVRDALRRALFGLTHYLDALADGATNATLRLFNEYQELHQARGLEMAFDIDLFFPSLQVDLPQEVLGAPQEGEAQARIKTARMQYQQSLLKWLRQDGADAAMENMAAAVRTVLACVPQDRYRAFWWVAGGLLDCLSHDGIPPELNVKRSLSRIDLKMKSLIEGGEFDEESALSEMLYLIARSHTVSDMVERIKLIYMLDEYLPEERPLPPSETTALLEEMRTLLNNVEEHWERCTGEDAEACKAFLERAEKLYILSERLDRNTLQFLSKQIHTAAQHVIDAERAPRIAMDMAMALLLLSSGIDHYQHLGNGFHEQCRILSSRLQAAQMRMPEDAEKLNDLVSLYRQMEQRDVLAPLANEMQGNLQNVEQSLSAFFNNAAKRSELTQINRLMGQVQGGMRLLSLDEADNLLTALRQVTDRYGQGQTPTAKEMGAVAASISALEEYVNGLAHGQKPDTDSLNTMLQDITLTGSIADAAAAQAEAEPAAPAGVSIRSGGEDAELLEVFLEEAREVMETLRSNLETSRMHLDSRDPLVTMRRSFHTLKGSSRMVGLSELGEVAWAIERAMNKWLQDNKPATPELLEMIGDAEVLFQHWVDMLISGSTSATINTANLLALADAIEHGKEQPLPGEETPQPELMPESEPVAVPEPEAETVQPELELKLESESPLSIEIATETPAATPVKNEANTDGLEDEGEIQVGTVKLSAMLFNIATEEGEGHVAALRAQQAVMHETDDHPITYDFMRAAHTLAGVNRTMGFKQVAELSQMLELWLEERIDKPNTVSEEQMQMVDQVIQTLDEMSTQIREQRQEPAAQPELIARLKSDREIVPAATRKAEDVPVAAAEAVELALDLEMPGTSDSTISELVHEATESIAAPDFEVGELTLGLAPLQMQEDEETSGVIEPEIDFSSIAMEMATETSVPVEESPGLAAINMLNLDDLAPQPASAEEILQPEKTETVMPAIDIGSLQLEMPPLAAGNEAESTGSAAIAALDLGSMELSEPGSVLPQVEQPETALPQIDVGGLQIEIPSEPVTVVVPAETASSDAILPLDIPQQELPTPELELPKAEQEAAALTELEPVMLQLDMPQEPEVHEQAEEPASFAIAALDLGEIKLDIPETALTQVESQPEPAAAEEFELQHFSQVEPATLEEAADTPREVAATTETEEPVAATQTVAEEYAPVEEEYELLHFSQVEPTSLEQQDDASPAEPQKTAEPEPEPIPAPPVQAEATLALPETTKETAETPKLSTVTTHEHVIQDELDDQMLPIFLEEADELYPQISKNLRVWREQPTNMNVGRELQRGLHTLKGSARMAGAMRLGELTHRIEDRVGKVMNGTVPDTEFWMLMENYLDRIGNSLEQLQNPSSVSFAKSIDTDAAESSVAAASTAIEPETVTPAVIVEQPKQIPEQSEPTPDLRTIKEEAPRVTSRRERTIRDEIDDQLLPIFLEEAQELYPQIGTTLRAWREQPEDMKQARELQRSLHTLKGSARMAGAMRLGELTHRVEDRVGKTMSGAAPDAEFWSAMDNYLDRIGLAIEQLQNPEAPQTAFEEPEESAAETATPEQGAVQQAVVAKTLEIGAERAVQAAQLRVRSDVVDRLVNEAGEVSVARARVELELREFKNSVLELTESVNRLRKQLREIEIQAESQMQARTAVSSDSAERFDPLEFDRFTRFQELTRFMNETVHDVQTVQQTLLKNLAETEGALSAQSQMNRDLQQGLMNIRMVPFASVSERLYRIVRQTGKELGKRANLELVGTEVELDRSVLERMTAPFEHLLRNSIAHGLETPEVREQAGKQPIGEIRLSLRQESNEVVFEFSDDGAGLNLEKLRKKAVEQGVLQPDEQVSDEQIMQLIFASGMSTADKISEIAGRGVGMDVVRSEITALGGRIDVTSEAGHGVRFMIHLPLTLAVTKTLMVRVGEKAYAIPASMVEHVHQLKPAALEATYHQHYSEWQGRRYPMYYLARLLGEESAEIISQPHNPVILLRSGENRIAVHVDELLGNFEAVVKNIGPQLSRVPGISGATVSADGSVILILNPISFTQRISTVRKAGTAPTVTAVAEPVEEVHTVPSVMVVDDSLTVRKITSRLLARAGYQVLTAKDGVDALEQLTEILPSVMLLDVEMPRMDGFELTKRLRQDPRTKAIPIIMITSRTADKHRQFAMELGVNEYMGKPYQEEELLAHIARFIGAGKA